MLTNKLLLCLKIINFSLCHYAASEGQMMEEDDTNHEETNKESETVLPPIRKSEHISHFTIRFPLTAEMSPKASLLVYYVREDGETVADSIDFKIESCFENKVN